MSIKDFLKGLYEEVEIVNSSKFEVEIIETSFVPSFSDPNITYDNLDTNRKKCKLLESCVLYVDIRNSAKISAENRPKSLAKMYSSFVSTMLACARHYGGHVRNIIGDRVMVVFDKKDCFTNAVDTAVLMNSVCKHILNKKIDSIEFSAGIGIDYGKMLITKSGVIRHGDEKEFYRSLVWLGQPANTASRLTDLANKKGAHAINGVSQGIHYPLTNAWSWIDCTFEQFVGELDITYSRNLLHKNEYFKTYILKELDTYTYHNSPILMTKAVYDGFKNARPNADSVRNEWWSKQSLDVRDYAGDIYGGDVVLKAAEEI